MMNPQRAHISGPRLDDVQVMMMSEPQVGDPMQLYLDNGKWMRTSPVRQVSRHGRELVVDTLNSRYRVTLAA
jgi:hypothetical protein